MEYHNKKKVGVTIFANELSMLCYVCMLYEDEWRGGFLCHVVVVLQFRVRLLSPTMHVCHSMYVCMYVYEEACQGKPL